MFHYQVGSLEEEPPVLAARMVERGLPARGGRVRPVAGRPPLRRVLRSRARPGSGSRSPAPRASRRSPRTPTTCSTRLRAGEPDVLVYFGLGVSSRAVALGARGARLGRAGARELGADVRLRASRLARRLRGLGVHRHDRRRQRAAAPRSREALAARGRRPDRLRARTTWAACSAKAIAPSRAPDPGRHRRRAAAREAAARDERATKAR